jgi:CHAT domain-containing protein
LVPDDGFVHIGKQQGNVAEIYIWLIKPSGEIYFETVDLRDRNTTLTELVQQSRASIGLRSRATIQVTYTGPPQAEQLHQLYQYLIAPIAHELPDDPAQEVIFIPQGQLFLVPFAALPTGPEQDSSYLIDQHTISMAPSAQMLTVTQQQLRSEISSWQANDFLIVGNPVMPDVWSPAQADTIRLEDLPNAQAEAEHIASLFGTQAYTQAAATESTVKQLLEDKTVLHFATHGLLDHSKPTTSGIRDRPGAIALAPGHGEDGLLTSAEISEASLQADLVVLSACDTGLGDITGDGVVGLSRAFMTAGAASIVMSLWSIPDAPTAQLMSAFYEAMQHNHHKSQALRQAMLQTKQIYPDPKDWAAFLLIGETR